MLNLIPPDDRLREIRDARTTATSLAGRRADVHDVKLSQVSFLGAERRDKRKTSILAIVIPDRIPKNGLLGRDEKAARYYRL